MFGTLIFIQFLTILYKFCGIEFQRLINIIIVHVANLEFQRYKAKFARNVALRYGVQHASRHVLAVNPTYAQNVQYTAKFAIILYVIITVFPNLVKRTRRADICFVKAVPKTYAQSAVSSVLVKKLLVASVR